MKKISATPEKVNEVANEVKAKTRKPRRTAKAEAAAPAPLPVSDEAPAVQPEKKPKIVEIICASSFLVYATAKAYLFKHTKADGEEESCWLAKSQMEISPTDAEGNITCKCAAWLYYRSGLKNFLPISRVVQA